MKHFMSGTSESTHKDELAKGLHVLAVEIGKIQAQLDRADENGEWGAFSFD